MLPFLGFSASLPYLQVLRKGLEYVSCRLFDLIHTFFYLLLCPFFRHLLFFLSPLSVLCRPMFAVLPLATQLAYQAPLPGSPVYLSFPQCFPSPLAPDLPSFIAPLFTCITVRAGRNVLSLFPPPPLPPQVIPLIKIGATARSSEIRFFRVIPLLIFFGLHPRSR